MIVRSPQRFLVAAVLVMVAALFRLALMSVLGSDTPFLTYFPAVMIAGLLGGVGPGLLATTLALLATVLLPPLDPVQNAWARPSAATLVVFGVAGALVAWMGGRVRRLVFDGERAVQAAIAAEQHAHGLLGSIGDAFISVDRDWRIRYANDAALRFVNVPRGEIVGRAWDASWPLLGDRARTTCRQAMTDRAALQVEDFNDALDRALDVRAYPSTDGGLSLYIADVSASHRANRVVADSERDLRLALRAGRVGTWRADVAAGTVSCSPEALDILGLPTGDVSGERLMALVHPDDVAAVSDTRTRALHDGTECAVEFRACRPDGKVVWLEVRGEAVGESGDCMAGVVLDATQRREAEHKRLAEAVQASPADAAAERSARDSPREEFVSKLAHELRTPLNAILGWCEVLRMSAGDAEQVGAAAEVIARNARAQARMITDFSQAHELTQARVRVEAPIDADAAGLPAAAPAGTATRLDGLTLLLLEDDADACAATQRLLEAAGAEVLVAGRAADALALLDRQPVHLIISDIGLPEMDGFEFIRRVRGMAPERGGSAPAIALTAYAHDYDRRRALLAGFQMHIVKPARPAEFLTAVQTLATLSRAAGLGRT